MQIILINVLLLLLFCIDHLQHGEVYFTCTTHCFVETYIQWKMNSFININKQKFIITFLHSGSAYSILFIFNIKIKLFKPDEFTDCRCSGWDGWFKRLYIVAHYNTQRKAVLVFNCSRKIWLLTYLCSSGWNLIWECVHVPGPSEWLY